MAFPPGGTLTLPPRGWEHGDAVARPVTKVATHVTLERKGGCMGTEDTERASDERETTTTETTDVEGYTTTTPTETTETERASDTPEEDVEGYTTTTPTTT